MFTTSVFAPITKSTENDDGTLYVYGKATGSDVDLDQQRCDPDWLKRAMPDWFQNSFGYGGNIREQHDSRRAIGTATDHEIKEDGHYIRAHIVDPVAVAKTKAGIFSGFSIGISRPRIEKSDGEEWIRAGSICEVSLVDRPCLPTATFTMCKSAKPGMTLKAGDLDSQRMLVRVEEFIESPEAKPELTVTLSENLSPEAAAKLDAIANEQVATGEGLMAGYKFAEGVVDGVKSVFKTTDFTDVTREKAIALVKSVVEKAGNLPPEYAPEQEDISGAQDAIRIISQLIQSEAAEMVDNPAEDCDIQLLLSAVSALRCFIGREQEQAMGADVTTEPSVMFSAEPDVMKVEYSAEQLRQMLADGKAMKNPNGEPSYPIGNKEDLENAIHAVGRGSGDHNAIRAFIKRRAKALGASNMIPDSWNGSDKGAEPQADDTSKTVDSVDETVDSAPVDVVEKTEDSGDVEKTDEPVENDVEKTSTPDTSKAAVEDDGESLVKALSAALEKADSPLRKSFEAIVDAATKSTAQSVSDLTERLEKFEAMATSGGPAMRRTEVERDQARRNDLTNEVVRYKSLAINSDDPTLRKGYAQKAAQLEAQIRAI